MSQDNNYKKYRTTLHSVSPPCLPYVGIYLTDLVFIEEGNGDTFNGLINFTKRKLVASVIRDFTQYQQVSYFPKFLTFQLPYYYEPVPLLQKWFNDAKPMNEELFCTFCNYYLETSMLLNHHMFVLQNQEVTKTIN